MITSFQESYFHPLRSMFFDRLQAHGVELPPQTWKEIAGKRLCRQLFEKAGLTDIRVEEKNMGYYLAGAEEWWELVWNAGFRRLVSQLTPDDRKQFKQEHLAEVEAVGDEKGIWLDIGVLYTAGSRPE